MTTGAAASEAGDCPQPHRATVRGRSQRQRVPQQPDRDSAARIAGPVTARRTATRAAAAAKRCIRRTIGRSLRYPAGRRKRDARYLSLVSPNPLAVVAAPDGAGDRRLLAARGRRLTLATLAYNSLEAAVALAAGAAAGSVALVGFGADSLIEIAAGGAAIWRLARDANASERERAERLARRFIGICFLALALYVLLESGAALVRGDRPRESWLGIAIAALSLVVMPVLAAAKTRVGRALRSRAVQSEAKQTNVCAWLSGILLGGLALNALLGWWWADPVAGLAMVPLIAWEGIEGVRGRDACGDVCDCD